MKYKVITIKTIPIEKALEKLKISKRSFGKIADVDVATCHKALTNELILCEKTAQKFIKALKYLQENPEICEKLRKITKRSSKGWHISREEVEQRNKEILVLREEGKTLAKIGEKYNLTKERIRQILLDLEIAKLRPKS